MRRLGNAERLLLAVWVPVWAVAFLLSVRTAARGPYFFSNVMVRGAESSDDFPRVIGFRPHLDGETELRPGDQLLRLGDSDLRGIGAVEFQLEVLSVAEAPGPIVWFERDGQVGEAELPVGDYTTLLLPMLPVSLVFAVVVVLLLIRAPPTPMVRAVFNAGMIIALYMASIIAGGRFVTGLGFAFLSVGAVTGGPMLVRAAQRFPVDEGPGSAWSRMSPWLLAALLLVVPSTLFGAPFTIRPEVGYPLSLAVMGVATVALLASATWSYRRADAIGRRQVKWVLFGAYAAGLPIAAAAALAAYEPRFVWLAVNSYIAGVCFPICLLVAVVRYNVFDIDRLLSATASYNIVIVLLAGAGFAVVPRAAEIGTAWLGVDPGVGQALMSLGLAAIVVPGQRRLRPRVEQIFFAERYSIDQGIGQLLQEIASCQEPGVLTRLAGRRLHELLRTESSAVYARDGSAYTPVFTAGPALPPAFAADGALVGALRKRTAPIVSDDFVERREGETLGPFDRAALETLGAAVVLPIHRGAELMAFLCLGPKRSGDVYTPTDVRLIGVVADKLASELLRFEQEELLSEARSMQESLRRYVPGAVAEQLSSGVDLESGTRDVTVLFVDIRGYTQMSERRRAEEIFSTVNQFTEAVSEIVGKHGGSIVEFNGDGMMAVFGAPRSLPEKERAAVDAGREIAASIPQLSFGAPGPESAKLSVGVGIATGEAFVGNVRSTDRLIWTALGNTTNLAARLENLTRELGAAVVIDAPTRAAAGGSVPDFQIHEGTRIRGRSEALTLYALPLQPPGRPT